MHGKIWYRWHPKVDLLVLLQKDNRTLKGREEN